jgi:hypothetical protein
MIPPVTTTPAISIVQPAAIAVKKLGTSAQGAIANWQDRSPVTSPDLHAPPAPRQIAQSEVPGSIPPVPSIRDTGNGYPTKIPRSYFGPAISTGNGEGSFGIISRFPLSENYSVRPSAVFGSNGTILRVPVTYDFTFSDKEPFERNPVVTFHAGGGVQFSSGGGTAQGDKFNVLATAGVDVNLFEGIALVSSYNTNFGSINGVNFGLGFEF